MSNEEDKKFEQEDHSQTLQDYLDSLDEGAKNYWLTIFFLLNKSERFQNFVEENFEIQKAVDHARQVVDIRVKEKEVHQIGPVKLDTPTIMKLTLMLNKAGAKSPAKVIESFVNIVNGKPVEESPLIVSASEADLQKELKKKL